MSEDAASRLNDALARRPKENSRIPDECRHDTVVVGRLDEGAVYHCVACGLDAPVQDWNMDGRRVLGPRII